MLRFASLDIWRSLSPRKAITRAMHGITYNKTREHQSSTNSATVKLESRQKKKKFSPTPAETRERAGLIVNICIAIADSCRVLGTMVYNEKKKATRHINRQPSALSNSICIILSILTHIHLTEHKKENHACIVGAHPILYRSCLSYPKP